MKKYDFPCFASAGKGDDADWDWEYEVTDEENERLIKAAKSGEDFCDCPEVKDIYDRIYNLMLDDQADVYVGDKYLLEEIEEYLREGEDDEDEKEEIEITKEVILDYITDCYTFDVGFPTELLDY